MGTAEGIIRFSMENFFGDPFSLEHLEHIYFCGHFGDTLNGQASKQTLHW